MTHQNLHAYTSSNNSPMTNYHISVSVDDTLNKSKSLRELTKHAQSIIPPPTYELIFRVSCKSHAPNRLAHTGSLANASAASVADTFCSANPSIYIATTVVIIPVQAIAPSLWGSS